MMPVSLELGGKSPTMVLADADLDHAVAGVLYGIFSSSGESCIAGSRLFVASERYDEFMERLATGAAALRVGDPADERTQMGPLISARHRESVERYVEMGVAEGGRLRTGAYVPMAQPSIVATSTPRPLSRGSPMAPACAGKRSSARCWWPCLHQRRGPDRGGQRQLLRAGRRHLDPRLPARLAARPRRAGRHRVDQHHKQFSISTPSAAGATAAWAAKRPPGDTPVHGAEEPLLGPERTAAGLGRQPLMRKTR